MPAGAFALALAAAVLHAAWNTLLARERDPQAAAAMTVVFAVATWLPVAVVLWRIEADAVPYVVASAALHLVYFLLLAAAYAGGELSLVYPLARGGAPLLLGAAGLLGLGGAVGAEQAAGVATIATGIVLVRGGGHADGRSVALAAGVAATIGGYTLVDRTGVAHANPVAYLWCVQAGTGIAQLAIMARLRGRAALRGAARLPIVLAGAMSFAAYALVLAALRLASAAEVASVRETSVVMAVAAAALVLGEPVTRRRAGGAVLVAAGTALVAA